MNQSASGIFGSFQPPTSKSPSLPPGILGNGSQGVQVETGGPSPSLKLCVLKGFSEPFSTSWFKKNKKKTAPPAVHHWDRLQNLNALQEFPPPAGFYPPRHPPSYRQTHTTDGAAVTQRPLYRRGNIRLASWECPADPGDLVLLSAPWTHRATSVEQQLFSSTAGMQGSRKVWGGGIQDYRRSSGRRTNS